MRPPRHLVWVRCHAWMVARSSQRSPLCCMGKSLLIRHRCFRGGFHHPARKVVRKILSFGSFHLSSINLELHFLCTCCWTHGFVYHFVLQGPWRYYNVCCHPFLLGFDLRQPLFVVLMLLPYANPLGYCCNHPSATLLHQEYSISWALHHWVLFLSL